MPVYGPNGGNVPFTGFSPTLGPDAISPVTSGNVQFNGLTQSDSDIARELFIRGNRGLRRLLLTLTGSAVGGSAVENFTRVKADQSLYQPTQFGGVVPVETVAQMNRVTTAADVTNINALLNRSPVLTFPADVSGNGGGSKLGY